MGSIFINIAKSFLAVLFTIVELIIILQIIFLFLGANPTARFVQFIYSRSEGLTSPFQGIFEDLVLLDTYVLDINALIAWLIYVFIFIIIMNLLNSLNKAIKRSQMQAMQ